jgi:hypothetical protein
MAILDRIEEVDWTNLFLGDGKRPRVAAYLARLQSRPSYTASMGERSEIAVWALRDLREAKRSSSEFRLALEGR